MAKNFHEQYSADAAPLPSERSTGLVFTVACIVVAYYWRASPVVVVIASVLAAGFLGASLLAPSSLKPLNVVWFKLAVLLNKVVSPIVMLALFAVVMVPFGLVMQLFRDPLQKRRRPDAQSYWIARRNDYPSDMSNQF